MLPATMKSVTCQELGSLDHVQIKDLPVPMPKDGEVLIKVDAAGLNFADTLMVKGRYQEKPDLPFTMGLELAGTIAAIGANVSDFGLGEPVFAVVPQGAFAGYAIAKASATIKRPANMPAAIAAALPINYGTAHGALAWKARLQKCETVLVHGAAGGTGLAAVACAKAMGERVIATARGAGRAAIALDHGADVALDSERADLVDAIKKAVDPKSNRGRIDVVFDTVGGALFDQSLRCLAFNGRLLLIGFAGGQVPQIPANILLVKNADAHGFYWGSYQHHSNALWRDGLSWVANQWTTGQITPQLDQEFALEDFKDAVSRLQARKATGKIILKPG